MIKQMVVAAWLLTVSSSLLIGRSTALADLPSNVQLAKATYHAQQVPGYVMIKAEGLHYQAGYVVFFEQKPIEVFPPQFGLWEARPAEGFPYVKTPFTQWTMFPAKNEVAEVVIHDANGTQSIPVEQVPDLAIRGGGGPIPLSLTPGGDGPTPFWTGGGGEGPNPLFDVFASMGVRSGDRDGGPIIKQTIGAFLESQPGFSKFAAYLNSAGMLEDLKKGTKLTVFVPTNLAIQSLSSGAASELKKPGKLEELIRYHVYSQDALRLKQISGMRSLDMDNGLQVWVHARTGKTWLRDQASRRADFYQADILLSNGVIHVMDSVMWPWSKYPTAKGDSYAGPRHDAHLETIYLTRPIELTVGGNQAVIRRLNIDVNIHGSSGSGQLRLDASTCDVINKFGDESNCNAGSYAPISIRLNRAFVSDPSGKGRHLFRIRSKPANVLGEPMFLVVPYNWRDSFRLVVTSVDQKAVVDQVTLERAP